MSAHTPGPWRRGKCYQSIVADAPVPGIKGSDDVEAYGGNLIAESVATQNIPLIAAAPELLAVLQRLYAHGYTTMADHAMVAEVIAKATGEAP